ncbi:MAG TPA: LamG domain-containing protein, partial [Humisphaera sp.]
MTTHRRLVVRRHLVPLALLLLASPAALGQSVEQGRFGRAIKVGASYAAAEHAPVYVANPLTVELWARVNGHADVSVLLSNEPRRSKHHWELYTEKETGRFAVSLPGYTPATIASTVDVADDAWHHLAFVLDGGTARLYVDGKPAAEQAVKQTKPYPDTGPLLFGYQPGVAPHPDTMIDEVRISRVARSFTAAPDKPYAPDADTIGLWHFDEDAAAQKKADGYADASAIGNTARPQQLAQGVADNGGFDNSVGGKTRWSDMDFGPFFSSTITPPLDKANVTHKGISIRLGKDKRHAVTFDTELLRMSAAWEGPFIKLAAGREGLSGHPEMGAKPYVATSLDSDWVMVGNPESNPVPVAGDPSPRRRGHFDGLYVSGDTV